MGKVLIRKSLILHNSLAFFFFNFMMLIYSSFLMNSLKKFPRATTLSLFLSPHTHNPSLQDVLKLLILVYESCCSKIYNMDSRFYSCVVIKQMNDNSYYITTSFIPCNTDSYYRVITIRAYQTCPQCFV